MPVALAALLAMSQPACAGEPNIRAMARQAIERAFGDHVERLFETWMREETADQAARVQRGMSKAIRAYLLATQAIERWRCER